MAEYEFMTRITFSLDPLSETLSNAGIDMFRESPPDEFTTVVRASPDDTLRLLLTANGTGGVVRFITSLGGELTGETMEVQLRRLSD